MKTTGTADWKFILACVGFAVLIGALAYVDYILYMGTLWIKAWQFWGPI
jgi:hypothetical protein